MTRAQQASTAEEERFYQRLKDAKVSPLWRIPGTDAPEPALDEVPYVWRWREILPLLEDSVEVADLGTDIERRALNAFNPTRVFGTTHTLVAGYQMVLPGEVAPSHRHTPGAIRLMLSGSGHTVVAGEPVLMEPGDLVLTPAGAWHDHRHEGTEPMIWLDGLDVPFVRGMRAQFYEEYPGQELQPLLQAEDGSVKKYAPGSVPAGQTWPYAHSPLTKYRWATSREAARGLYESSGKPAEGSTIEYVNPLTGGHVLPTIACYLSLVPQEGATLAKRHTSSAVVCVLEGKGHTLINGERFDWEKNDFFALPSWYWYQHVADEGSDAFLFTMSDLPLLEPFGLYREQRDGEPVPSAGR